MVVCLFGLAKVRQCSLFRSSMEKQIFKKNVFLPPLPKGNLQTEHYSPSNWNDYFDTSDDVNIPDIDITFRVYTSGTDKPDLVAFVLMHGAGHSALSWGLMNQELKRLPCQIYAFDARAHGQTVSTNSEDLSEETLINDTIILIKHLFAEKKCKIILVGHSMGGAIAAKVAAKNEISNLCGLVVVDVVEGTALAALPSMEAILNDRPKQFLSVEAAIQWSLSSGMIKNSDSARLSVPSLLKELDSEQGRVYGWKTDLLSSQPFWTGWFTDLSKCFLMAKAAKLLILAGTDRLDKDLTIAQMQGKFQLIVLPTCGHAIQEDDPVKTANALLQFCQRNRW